MWNRHKKTKNTKLYEVGSGTKLLFTFLSLKVMRERETERQREREREREAQSFYADFSICPHHVRHPAANYWSGLGEPQKSTFFRSGNSTNWLFSNPSKSSAHASGAWCHSHSPVNLQSKNFYFDISEWHVLPARAGTPALMLHLTNPCAKRMVLSLTKWKGKIYKTKSLCHYITGNGIDNSSSNPERCCSCFSEF